MSQIYAPPAPTATDDTITVSRFVNNPVYIFRTLRGLVEQRMVGGRILSGRVDLTGSGAAIFEVGEGIYANDDSEIVDDLMDYPLTDDTPGDLAVAATEKWGLGTEISDKVIARNRMDIVRRKLLKIANRIAINFDSLVLSAVGSAVTETQAATAAWSAAGANPFLDAMLSEAKIDELDEGFMPDVILCRPVPFARLVAAAKTMDYLPREGGNNVLLTGRVVVIAGLTIIKTNRLPAGVQVMVLDSTQLGAIAYERLGGGYQGDPADPVGVESKVLPLDGGQRDGVRINARKVAVPMIQEPRAAVVVTGVV
jgi:hypothetical protein